jgi:hypothetical protein
MRNDRGARTLGRQWHINQQRKCLHEFSASLKDIDAVLGVAKILWAAAKVDCASLIRRVQSTFQISQAGT